MEKYWMLMSAMANLLEHWDDVKDNDNVMEEIQNGIHLLRSPADRGLPKGELYGKI